MVVRKKTRVSEEMIDPVKQPEQSPEKPLKKSSGLWDIVKSTVISAFSSEPQKKPTSTSSHTTSSIKKTTPSYNIRLAVPGEQGSKETFTDFNLDEMIYAFDVPEGEIPYKTHYMETIERDELGFQLEPDLMGIYHYMMFDATEPSKITGVLSRRQIHSLNDGVLYLAQRNDEPFIEPVLMPMLYSEEGIQPFLEIKSQFFEKLAQYFKHERDRERRERQSESARYSRSIANSRSETTRFQRSLIQMQAEKVEAEKKAEQLEESLRIDTKTKLYTNLVLEEKKAQFIADAIAGGYELAIGFGDISDFKQYNTVDPTQVLGDNVIVGVGEAIRNSTRREGEYGFRRVDPTGGNSDEFVFVFERKSKEDANKSMELIRDNVEKLYVDREGYSFEPRGAENYQVGLDTGIGYFSPESIIEKVMPVTEKEQQQLYSEIFDEILGRAQRMVFASKVIRKGGRSVLTKDGTVDVVDSTPLFDDDYETRPISVPERLRQQYQQPGQLENEVSPF